MQGIVKPTPGPGRKLLWVFSAWVTSARKDTHFFIQATAEKHSGSRRHVLYARQQRQEWITF